MKKLLAIFFVLFMLVVCAASAFTAAVLVFGARTASSSVIPRPPVQLPDVPALELIATPTLAPSLFPGGPGGGEAAPGGFNGAFSGTLTANNGSSAPATLSLTQNGSSVSGRLSIGSGLSIDGGFCGAVAVPAGDQAASGAVDPANPNRLSAAGQFPVMGITINAGLVAELSAAGDALATQVNIDLPFICGRDASISGSFARQ
ncbi:MAG: hypothetical protein LC131_01565 [Anaerolineae bacterium]|nr:hypothetical protein [Anaerolineae bacterium]